MALSNLKAPRIMACKSGPVMVPLNRVMVLGNSQLPLRRAPAMRIRSSLKNQVFEDRAEGIICYRDENGEIICEGLDEGPRFQPKILRAEYHPRFRDAKIIGHLQQNWIQLVNGREVYEGGIGLMAQEGFNWNGFNRFH
ncbi:uncharacterized protein LOC104419525 isoform X3 [Eucalyptus grandis]|uniref:uncharacterized protein LOC104419525 isoform X3 n=1 Tax=Eucalyptus grandis TaxID=71139 RepID=UPI000527D9D9|nr:uncharacterized protein LOC104419525 isoform X3 [Eucalyptus grandis]